MDMKRSSRWVGVAAGLALIAAMAVAGVATALLSSNHSDSTAHASIDLSGLGDLPADTRAAYEAAPSHRDLFAHLPCYCGCGLLKEPHGSLDRCFLLPDGRVEAHASGCRICVDIATQALVLESQGLDHASIRARIDEQFARAGPPTDTPLPQ
jgi:hypothetical protein